MANDATWMQRALELGRRGQGAVEPNPMVGCVIVRDQVMLGEGWHERCGEAHAEVNALAACRASGHDSAGSTVYVTLEPCSHHGRTPPCAEALVAAGVSRVVIGTIDPHDKVNGQGVALLREAGVRVDIGVCEAEARELIEPFTKRVTTGLPWVIAKWAQTLDGRIATRTGHSQWISNAESREYVHQLRGRVDAVMVGGGTARTDDPRLTARPSDMAQVHRVAQRVVVDPRFRLSDDAQLLRTLDEARLTIAVSRRWWRELMSDDDRARLARWEGAGVRFVPLPRLQPTAEVPPGEQDALDLRPLLSELASQDEATNVLVEGGGTLMGHLFEQYLIDEVLVFIAPKVIGDDQAVPAVRGLVCEKMDRARDLSVRAVQRFGNDMVVNYRVKGFSR